MSRNLFTLLFGATLLVAIFMITNAQPNVPVSVLPVSMLPVSVLPVSVLPVSVLPVGLKFQKQRFPRPTIPTWRPNIPTWRPPTRRPIPPTRRPTPPTRRPTPPTRRPAPITLRPTPPTKRPTPPTKRPTPTPPTKRPPTWTVTITVTRKPRMVKRSLRRKKCSKLSKCTTVGPSLCVRSRKRNLCRRVANSCALRKLKCQAKPRNNWGITQQTRCGKLKVGAKAEKCKN